MIVDTSVLVAILEKEPGFEVLLDALLASPAPQMSAATWVEAGMVMLGRHGDTGSRALDVLLQARIEIVPLTAEHAGLARDAFRRFGKGRHPARLNSGDCFSYALAAALGEPLLFVGQDFSRTDITLAG